VVLKGTVEGIYSMTLDVEPVPFEDAIVLKRYKVPLVDLTFRGDKIVSSAMFWPRENNDSTITVLAHSCTWNKWGK
jgi:hypothetical protein